MSDPSAEQMLSDLERIDPDHSYDVWLRAGIALFNYYEGSERGLRVWEDWSRRGPKFEEGACAKKWKHLLGMRNQGKYTQTWWHFRAFAKKRGAMTEKTEKP